MNCLWGFGDMKEGFSLFCIFIAIASFVTFLMDDSSLLTKIKTLLGFALFFLAIIVSAFMLT